VRRGACHGASFAPDGKTVARIGRNVGVWEVDPMRRLISAHPISHPSDIAYSPSGQLLAVKSTSGESVVLDATTLEVAHRLGGAEFGEGSGIAWADESSLVDGSWSGDLILRDVRTGAIILHETSHGGVSQLVVDPERPAIVHTASHDEAEVILLRTCPLDRGDETVIASLPAGEVVSAIAVRGDLLAVASHGHLEIRSIATGAVLADRAIPISGTGFALVWRPGHDHLCAAGSGTFSVFDPDLHELWSEADDLASAVAVSAEADLAVFGSWERSVVCTLA
jgi:hypothetical protein